MYAKHVILIGMGAIILVAESANAQAPPSNLFGARSRSECPKEAHPQAIDPQKVECFAEFAPEPFPRVPGTFNPSQQEIAALYEKGYELVRQLNRPGVCDKESNTPKFRACALIVYTIDAQFRQTGLPLTQASYVGPWTFLIKIYRINHPKDERDTTIWTVNSDFSDGWFGPGAKNPVWKLTAVQRQNERCRETRDLRLTANMKISPLSNTCRDDLSTPSFTPMLIIPYSTASEFFESPDAIARHFNAPPYYVENPELKNLH
jgi:hypothetical protein